jgi:hypothetical protein
MNPRLSLDASARKPSNRPGMKYLFLIIGLIAGFQASLIFSRPYQPVVFLNGDPDCVILGPQTHSIETALQWSHREQTKHAGSSSIIYGHLRYDPEFDMVFTKHKLK